MLLLKFSPWLHWCTNFFVATEGTPHYRPTPTFFLFNPMVWSSSPPVNYHLIQTIVVSLISLHVSKVSISLSSYLPWTLTYQYSIPFPLVEKFLSTYNLYQISFSTVFYDYLTYIPYTLSLLGSLLMFNKSVLSPSCLINNCLYLSWTQPLSKPVL